MAYKHSNKENKSSLNGMRFGLLVVISSESKKTASGSRRFCLCKCDCGKEKYIPEVNLKKGKTKSCGCISIKLRAEKRRRHGMTDSYEYRKWAAMRSECYNAKYRNYKFFGDRGIVMSEEWKNSFVAFKKDIGERPSTAHFISRIDKNGNYCKENCEWVKKTERVVKTIEYKGVSGTVSKWAKKFKIDKDTVNKRLRLGWSIEQALETPLNKRRKAKIKTTCVYLNLPDDLVKKIDKFAKKNKISRSGIVKKILSIFFDDSVK